MLRESPADETRCARRMERVVERLGGAPSSTAPSVVSSIGGKLAMHEPSACLSSKSFGLKSTGSEEVMPGKIRLPGSPQFAGGGRVLTARDEMLEGMVRR